MVGHIKARLFPHGLHLARDLAQITLFNQLRRQLCVDDDRHIAVALYRIPLFLDGLDQHIVLRKLNIRAVNLKGVCAALLHQMCIRDRPYCPRCGTALSSHEVAQGYKDLKERSATVRFRCTDEELSLIHI